MSHRLRGFRQTGGNSTEHKPDERHQDGLLSRTDFTFGGVPLPCDSVLPKVTCVWLHRNEVQVKNKKLYKFICIAFHDDYVFSTHFQLPFF